METLMVLTIVSLAGIYAGRRAWLAMKAARKPKAGCGQDCGCESVLSGANHSSPERDV